MQYKIYRLRFLSGVHFGETALEDGDNTFHADTLFSAICHEAIACGAEKLEEVVALVKSNKLCFSDAFPYVGTEYYIPKPMMRIEAILKSGDSVIKKAYKKLKFIECKQMENYLNGTFDVSEERSIEELGLFSLRTLASIRGELETKPYRVGTYYFNDGNGLYIIIGYETDEALKLIEELLDNLSLAGIGGKRTSGLGRFELLKGEIPSNLKRRMNESGNKYMTLSISLPKEAELINAITDAQYILKKRSGFVASVNYGQEQVRKKDMYMFAAGSCFPQKYEGNIYDVSNGGKHPVYRYAKPLFMNIT